MKEKICSVPAARDVHLQNVCADGLFGHRVCKVLCNLIVDVGLKKGKSDLAHCLLDIAFGQLAFALELFECVLQLVC